eukprot:8574378-Alexandrium_andersonii.AAC.1
MSASLVGSEMCIRDRPSSAPRAAGGPLGFGRPLGDTSAGGRTLGDTGAVSYTHLTLPTICSV